MYLIYFRSYAIKKILGQTNIPILQVYQLFLLFFSFVSMQADVFPCGLTIICIIKSYVLFCPHVPLVNSYTQNLLTDRQCRSDTFMLQLQIYIAERWMDTHKALIWPFSRPNMGTIPLLIFPISEKKKSKTVWETLERPLLLVCEHLYNDYN